MCPTARTRLGSAALFCLSLPLACASIDELLEDERDCDTRQAYYPDGDGDGVGADSPVYIGCEAREGYVDQGGDCDDTDPSTTDCPDSAEPGDTGDSAGPEDSSEPGDTGDTGDTGVTGDGV